MPDAIAIARAVLVAAAGVTTIVDPERIEALRRTQSFVVPAITLQNATKTPANHLQGWAGLDENLVQIDHYGNTYTEALTIAQAARTALEAAGFTLLTQSEGNDPENDPELFQITQTWNVFSS